MPVQTGPYLNTKDIYIDYPFEDVMFRRMMGSGDIYRKCYGELESPVLVAYNNHLYADALRSGTEITKEEYDIGKDLK